MKGKRYSQYEIEILERFYRSKGAPWCSQFLGRTPYSVREKAVDLGIAQKRNPVSTATILQWINRLHPLGYTDIEIYGSIVADVGRTFDHDRVGKLRAGLGLLSNVSSDRHRSKLRDAAISALAKNNARSLTDLRWKQWRKWKRDRGLPEDLTNLAAIALDHFFNLGPGVPITRVTLCHLLGVDPKRKNAPISNKSGGSVLSELFDRGFIGRLKHAHEVPYPSGRFSGRTVKVDLYYLVQGVKRNEQFDDAGEGVENDSECGRPSVLANKTPGSLH